MNMKPKLNLKARAALLVVAVLAVSLASIRLRADSGTCSGQTITLPFTDVMGSPFFCSIATIYFQGITLGTTPATYSPSNNVTRDQMAAFLSRTLDTGLKRGSRRAALDQFWTTTPYYDLGLGTTPLAGSLKLLRSDGADIWMANPSGLVFRVRASDGILIGNWSGATNAFGVLCAMGRIFITGGTTPTGHLYMINPEMPGAVTTVSSAVGSSPAGIAFDGKRIWTANIGSVSIVTPAALPYSVNNVLGFGTLSGIVYDGAFIWVTEAGTPGSLKKLNSEGDVLQTVTVGDNPLFPVFDGRNIWVPNHDSHTVTVVRAASGEVLASLSGNGLNRPTTAAFDGERVLITNFSGDKVSLWKATDLTSLGDFSTGTGSSPYGACSDGQYFWIGLSGTNRLARF